MHVGISSLTTRDVENSPTGAQGIISDAMMARSIPENLATSQLGFNYTLV